MFPNIKQPWMHEGGIEFFADNGAAYCMENGVLTPFAEITIKTFEIILNDFYKHPEVDDALEEAGITDLMQKLQQYVICRYGKFNNIADFVEGKKNPDDQELTQLHCESLKCRFRHMICNPHSLTHRELIISSLVKAGLSDKEIAARLFISTLTVSTHITNILAKLGVPNRAAIAAFAATNELTAFPNA